MSKVYAKILIPKHDKMSFIYSVPPHLDIKEGDAVEVELRRFKIWGLAESFINELPPGVSDSSVKPVLGKIISTPVFKNSLQTKFLKWISDYYMYPFSKIVRQILSPLIGADNSLKGDSDPLKHSSAVIQVRSSEKVELNEEQFKVLSSIRSRWSSGNISPVLVYGVTGSGKSEVFAKLCTDVIEAGKQVLYLVPEIGLTGQTVEHLIKRIGYPGIVLHSFMSSKKRFSSLYAAMNKEAFLIVGTRSAILYPFIDPGLIIVDEEHDQSYKNFEAPYYSARDAAVMKGTLLKIPVVLGSATPSSDSWLNAKNGKYHMEQLLLRANSLPMPAVKQFEYKGELYIPAELIESIRASIENEDQTLFFLNRRGFATFPYCPECGEIVKCTNCKTALVYHKKKNRLFCHHCSYNIMPDYCDKCKDVKLEFEGMGVEKLKEALDIYFPGSRIISFDKDSLSTPASFEKAVKTIAKGEGDIIVGTVMVSKGHNFRKLKNVVIKHADYLLSFRDTRAAEKCFQIITQVAGRAGRFSEQGSVWAETLNPDHYIWQYVHTHDYPGFMKEELSWRERLMLPPYTRMTIIRISGAAEEKVKENTLKVFDKLEETVISAKLGEITIHPPDEPPLSRIRNRFRMNITVISQRSVKGQKQLYSLLRSIPEFRGINILFDIDATNET